MLRVTWFAPDTYMERCFRDALELEAYGEDKNSRRECVYKASNSVWLRRLNGSEFAFQKLMADISLTPYFLPLAPLASPIGSGRLTHGANGGDKTPRRCSSLDTTRFVGYRGGRLREESICKVVDNSKTSTNLDCSERRGRSQSLEKRGIS